MFTLNSQFVCGDTQEKYCMLQPDGTTKQEHAVEGWVYIIYVDKKTADCAFVVDSLFVVDCSLTLMRMRLCCRLPQAH